MALPIIDAADDAAADIIARAEAGRRFELATGPLLRTVLIRVARDPGRHRLVVVLHHAAADGWSLGVLVRELAALYGGEALPALPLRYADAARDQARISARDLAYWRHHLDGLPPPEPLPFATDPHATSGLDRDPVVRHDLPAATIARLEALGRAQGVTAFMILSAAVQILLARLSGQVDFAIGTPVAGRDRPALEPLVGFLVNTVVLRSSLTAAGDQAALRQLLAAIRSDTLAALAHQSLPFDRLVDVLAIPRSGTDNPLFRVLVAVQNTAIRIWCWTV
ncbi:condensation domain-containing protein [Tistrella bauzanensis]